MRYNASRQAIRTSPTGRLSALLPRTYKISPFNFLIKKNMHVMCAAYSTVYINQIRIYSVSSLCMHQWAHFPHIHFGLMPDQGLKKTGIQSQVKSKDGP